MFKVSAVSSFIILANKYNELTLDVDTN